MKIIKDEHGKVSVNLQVDVILKGENLEVFKQLEKFGCADKVIEGMFKDAGTDELIINKVEIMEG